MRFSRMRSIQTRRQLRRLCLQFFMALFSLILLLLVMRLYAYTIGYMPKPPVEQQNRDFDKYLTKYEHNYWKNTTEKKILIWTPFFGGWGWLDYWTESLPQCKHKYSCVATSDRNQLESSDAVVFHANDIWKFRGLVGTIKNIDVDYPPTRTPNQVWAMLSLEPMIYMWGNIKPHTFNWTMLYRRESTIYYPFTNWRKKTGQMMTKSTKRKTNENFLASKTKFAATMVSNCKDQGRRYRIIREIQRYVEVDDFGACSGRVICKAGIPTYECGQRYLKEYKFYLAFENSFCRDYVSEKYWNALDRHQIPVIAAPNFNLELLPPHSYLNVFDFPSIKDLTDKMIEISENDSLYNSYFDWMDDYYKDEESVYCKMCKELHSNRPAQSYGDIEAWIRDDMCTKSSAFGLISGFFDRVLFDLGLS